MIMRMDNVTALSSAVVTVNTCPTLNLEPSSAKEGEIPQIFGLYQPCRQRAAFSTTLPAVFYPPAEKRAQTHMGTISQTRLQIFFGCFF